jgi:LuxR family quorum sensing-dependent transcriptional regulator
MWEHSHTEAVKFLQKASEYEDSARLEAHFLAVLSAFGFDRYACAKFEAGPEGNQITHLARAGLEDWDEHWRQMNYADVDPVAKLGLARRPQFSWADARDWSRQHRGGGGATREQQLWGEAAEAGMGEGLVSYAYGPGGELLVVRMTTAARRIRPADRPMLDAIAIVFSTMRLRLHEREADTPQGLLTVREQQCLRWASQGLVDFEIADQLAISAKTVAFHMENAKRKLGARNRLAAYRRALELGYLAT